MVKPMEHYTALVTTDQWGHIRSPLVLGPLAWDTFNQPNGDLCVLAIITQQHTHHSSRNTPDPGGSSQYLSRLPDLINLRFFSEDLGTEDNYVEFYKTGGRIQLGVGMMGGKNWGIIHRASLCDAWPGPYRDAASQQPSQNFQHSMAKPFSHTGPAQHSAPCTTISALCPLALIAETLTLYWSKLTLNDSASKTQTCRSADGRGWVVFNSPRMANWLG